MRLNVRQLLGNIGSILTSEAFNRAVTFVIYLLVARYFDEATFGRLSVAFTLFYVTQVLGSFGLNTYISREASKEPDAVGRYLVHGMVVALTAASLAYVLLTGFTFAAGYAPETRTAILLLAIGAVPLAVATVCHGVFQALERMPIIPAVNIPAHVLKLAAAFVMVQRGVAVEGVILAIVATQFLAAGAVVVIAMRLARERRSSLAVQIKHLRGLVLAASAFVGIDVVIALWSGLPLLLLSLFAVEAEVGRYSAAHQLIVPVSLLMNATMVAALPLMSRTLSLGAERLRNVTKGVLTVTLALALPAAVGLMLVANDALSLIYGAGFESAGRLLAIVAPLIVFQAMTSGLGNALYAGMMERATLRIVSVNCIATLVLGLVLIPGFGATGAAVAALSVGVLNLVQHFLPVNRLLGRVLALVAAAGWRPLIATAVMAGVLRLLDIDKLLWAVPTGIAVYLVSFGLIFLISGGRPSVLSSYLTRTGTRT